MSNVCFKSKKLHGGVSIELSLSFVMILVLIFACINLFGAQLMSFATNGGIKLFYGNDAKVAFSIDNNAANRSDTLVQIAGQQGLSWYAETAVTKIEEYSAISPQDMTQAQLEDLAKWATVLKIADSVKFESLNLANVEPYKIYVNVEKGKTLHDGIIIIGYSKIKDDNTDKERIKIIKGIL